MPTVYCKRWNKKLSQPIEEFSEEVARRLHESGEPYTAASVVKYPGLADRYLEIALRSHHVRVHFLDEYGRVETVFTFRKSKDGTSLFLWDLASYEYDPRSTTYLSLSQSDRITVDEYNEDGTGLQRFRDKVQDTSWEAELTLKDDRTLATHYEPLPTFGDYASLARPYRNKPPIPFG